MADRRLRRHLGQDEMNRGIGMLHSGLSQRHVANILGVSQIVVSRMWNRLITTGNVRHLHAGGRERSTNEVQDRFLVVQARRHRFDNATTLSRDFQNATGVCVSTQTIRNQLHDAGLRSRRLAIRVPLTRYHLQMRLAWARDHVTWTQMTGPQSCLQTSPGFVWTLPIDVLGYGECQMSVLLQFVWQNMIGLAGAQSWFGRE